MPTVRALNKAWALAVQRLQSPSHSTSLRLDAVGLMRAAHMEPDPWQVKVAQTSGDQLLLCHRQSGKSTIVAAIGCADAIEEDNALVLLISPSLRQSSELFRKVKTFYNAVRPMPLIQESALSMEFANHSRIVSLPGSAETIVGYSKVKRIIPDEASRVTDAVYYAMRPMLAMSGGSILAPSTPYGKRGWFFEAWEQDDAEHEKHLDKDTVAALLQDLGIRVQDIPDAPERSFQWSRTRLTAPENPRLSPYFLANERRQVPDLWFRQEWLCEFVETMDTVFRYEDVQGMLDPSVMPLFSNGPHRDVLADIFSTKVVPLFGGLR